MSLATINRSIQKQHPEVTLHKGEDYFYYVFDNTKDEDPASFTCGKVLIYETTSVFVPYLRDLKDDRWVREGVEFGDKTKKENDV